MEITAAAIMVVLKFLEVFGFPLGAALCLVLRAQWKRISEVEKKVAALAKVQGQIEEQGQSLQNTREQLITFKADLRACQDDLKDMPTQKALHEFAIQLERLSGKVEVVNERFETLGAIVERVERFTARQEDYLLNNKGNG